LDVQSALLTQQSNFDINTSLGGCQAGLSVSSQCYCFAHKLVHSVLDMSLNITFTLIHSSLHLGYNDFFLLILETTILLTLQEWWSASFQLERFNLTGNWGYK